MDIKFVDTDPLYYESQLVQNYELITNRTLNPADPERILINLLNYVITICSINIDYAAKMNLLSTAKNEYLEGLGELFDCIRLPAQKSKTTIRFYTSEPLAFDIVIPKNTKVGADSENYFYTLFESKILAGNLYTDSIAEFYLEGSIGNNFAISQINKLMDLIPYISKVENISMSMFGTNIEDDERYRSRIYESISSFSTAGSRDSYIYHTKSAHQDINDVSVFSPIPGQVNIYFLLKNGQIPNQTMIDTVANYLSSDKIRPLTDTVLVQAPSIINYNINFKYFINRDFEPIKEDIQIKVSNSISEFINFTKKLGRDILPEKLTELIMNIQGIHSIDIISPSKLSINNDQVAICQNISFSYQGIKE